MVRPAPKSSVAPASSSPTLTFDVQESTGIVRAPRGSTKHAAYPHVVAAVERSLSEKKAFKFAGLSSPDAVKAAKNMLAQVRNSYVAKGAPIAVKQSVDAHKDGTFTLHFQAAPGTRKRSYTAAQIRTWWTSQGGAEIVGKIPADVRAKFKAAHGYK